MKLASYEVDGRRSYGVVTDDGILDVGGAPGAPPTLLDALAASEGRPL